MQNKPRARATLYTAYRIGKKKIIKSSRHLRPTFLFLYLISGVYSVASTKNANDSLAARANRRNYSSRVLNDFAPYVYIYTRTHTGIVRSITIARGVNCEKLRLLCNSHPSARRIYYDTRLFSQTSNPAVVFQKRGIYISIYTGNSLFEHA